MMSLKASMFVPFLVLLLSGCSSNHNGARALQVGCKRNAVSATRQERVRTVLRHVSATKPESAPKIVNKFEVKLESLPKSKVSEAAKICARALQNDPPNLYIDSDVEKRRNVKAQMYERTFAENTSNYRYVKDEKNGKVVGIVDFHLVDPSKKDNSKTKAVSPAVSQYDYLDSDVHKKRVEELAQFSKKYMSKIQEKRKYFYLGSFAVSDAYQGQGIGSNMLKKLFAEADEAQLPIILCTTVENNAKYYQKDKFGFKIVDYMEGIFPFGKGGQKVGEQGAKLHVLIREPKPLRKNGETKPARENFNLRNFRKF